LFKYLSCIIAKSSPVHISAPLIKSPESRVHTPVISAANTPKLKESTIIKEKGELITISNIVRF
jgi:hypothetical protein